jgi:hypothetical protein
MKCRRKRFAQRISAVMDDLGFANKRRLQTLYPFAFELQLLLQRSECVVQVGFGF